MAYLIDTDTLIYSVRKHPVVLDHLKANTQIPMAMSVITYGELIFGARKSRQVEKNLAGARRLSEIFPIIEVTRAVMETFGSLKAGLQEKGVNIADLDLIIGSTALTMNYCLVTNNENHFKRIPGLEIENWTKE